MGGVCKSCARRFYFSFTFVLTKLHAAAVERRRWPLLRLAVAEMANRRATSSRRKNLDCPALPCWSFFLKTGPLSGLATPSSTWPLHTGPGGQSRGVVPSWLAIFHSLTH